MPTYKNISTAYQFEIDSNGDRQEVAPDGTIETYRVLDDTDIWEKQLDTPYYNIAADNHDVTFTSPGGLSQEVTVDPDNSVFEIRSDVACTVHANHASAEGYPVLADTPVQIRHSHNIEKLILVATEAGTADVIELED